MTKLTGSLEKSEQTQSEAENRSVFDFLYVDHQRISTFLSQFGEFGGLTGIVHEKTAGRGKVDGGTVKAQGSAIVVKGEANYTASTNAEYGESSQRTYDPLWSNTLGFLDKIEEKGLLIRDITQAGFGDLVLVKGPVSVRDFGILEEVWKLPSFRSLIKRESAEALGNRADRRRHAKSGKKSQPSDMDLLFDLIKIMPHPTQFKIGDFPSAWGVLREDGLVSMASDFVLKFGGAIPGEWAAVCILDALPDQFEDEDANEAGEVAEEIANTILQPIEPLIRQFLGRPEGAYGVTPLAVFREVGR